AESFFRNQTTNGNNQWRNRGKICTSEFGEIESVINAVDAPGATWKSLTQELRGVIRFGDDCPRRINEFVQSDFELPWRENVVRVCCKAETDLKKFVDPEGSARGHASEMRVHVRNAHLAQQQPDINSLVKSKEIGAAPPFIERGDNVRGEFPLLGGVSNVLQQILLLWQIMHAFDDARVPILWRLVFRPANGKDWRRDLLAIKLRHLAVAKRLSERWEALKKVSKTRHRD